MGLPGQATPWPAASTLLVRLVGILLVWMVSTTAIKLRMQKSECVSKTIDKESLVTVVIVATPFKGQETFFNFEVKDPLGNEVYSKQDVETAEISFSTRVEGAHSFCFTLSPKNTNLGSGIGSPRVGKKLREVAVDILVGETWSHDRVLTEHLDVLMENISNLKIRMQKLKSEVRYLKFREIRHRKTVKSTARRVTRYALGKMVVIIIIAIAQPVIIAVFFQRQFKY